YLNNIESRYADSYRVWWRFFSRNANYEYPLASDKIFWDKANNAPAASDAANWQHADISVDENGKCSYTIPNCTPNQYYVVALVGTNAGLSGTSDARFAYDRNGSCDNIQFIMPYPDHNPAYAPVMNLATEATTRNIMVSLASPDPEQNRFIIEWKSAADPVWNRFDSYIDTNGGLFWGSMTYKIANLNPLTAYSVKAYAMTVNNLKGPEATQQAVTGMEGDLGVAWSFQDSGGQYSWPAGSLNKAVNSDLLCEIKSLPAGTASYSITGALNYSSKQGWLYNPVVLKSKPITISNYAASTTKFTALTVMTHWWLGIINIEKNDGYNITYTITAYDANHNVITSKKVVGQMISLECPRKE
ncbi:MAG TPA: hypothetical protein PKN50_08695, partial [Spirochaetota bacterium]|nr:hypothetical protein [Spirochaetota bacterium]